MAGPQVKTVRDPSGGSSIFNTGWAFVTDKVFAQDPPGTQVRTSEVDLWAISIAGFDLWGAYISIDALAAATTAKGAHVYYISLWRNPPRLLGTGGDFYTAVAVTKA